MKKLISLMAVVMICTGLYGCRQQADEQPAAPQNTADESDKNNEENLLPEEKSKVLVAYFSCTGNTKQVAETIAETTDAVLYEIIPTIPYTPEDLNYNDSSARAVREQNDDNVRPEIASADISLSDYDVVFIGYPIWWGQAPKIISTFLETHDFSGKTIIPFCTSGSSGIGSSAANLHSLCSESATWQEGRRFSAETTQEEIEEWVNSMGIIPAGIDYGSDVTDMGLKGERMRNVHITVGSQVFEAEFYDNEAAQTMISEMPFTLEMNDYASQEKVTGLSFAVPSVSLEVPDMINVGEIYLWSGSSLVLFYTSFQNSYSYVPIGYITDTRGLAAALGSGSVTVEFELAE